MNKSLRRNRAFTLIELLVVVLILGVLVSFALPSYLSSISTAKQNTADGNARAISSAIQSAGVRGGAYSATALSDSGVLSDMGGAIPNNPCSVSTGAGGYTYTYTSANSASIQAKNDTCTGYTGKTYTLAL